jgi:hypothetical protein
MYLVHLTIRAEELEKRVFKVNHLDTFIDVLHVNRTNRWKQRLTLDSIKLLLEWVGHLNGCAR